MSYEGFLQGLFYGNLNHDFSACTANTFTETFYFDGQAKSSGEALERKHVFCVVYRLKETNQKERCSSCFLSFNADKKCFEAISTCDLLKIFTQRQIDAMLSASEKNIDCGPSCNSMENLSCIFESYPNSFSSDTIPHKLVKNTTRISRAKFPIISALDEIVNHTQNYGSRFDLVDKRFAECDTLDEIFKSFSKSELKILSRFYYTFFKYSCNLTSASSSLDPQHVQSE